MLTTKNQSSPKVALFLVFLAMSKQSTLFGLLTPGEAEKIAKKRKGSQKASEEVPGSISDMFKKGKQQKDDKKDDCEMFGLQAEGDQGEPKKDDKKGKFEELGL